MFYPEKIAGEEFPIRKKINTIIFGSDTFLGKLFDIVLIWCILISVGVVMLDSIAELSARFGEYFVIAEWVFTTLFTIEYLLRLASVNKPLNYATSFFGVIDLLAIVPTYAGLFFPSGKYLVVIRVLRVLRVFRVLKFVQYIGEADMLIKALAASRRKITVFIFSVLAVVIVIGSIMYIIEGEGSGFTSIPKGIYWAIVTMTTVGYGDIAPVTVMGQTLASVVMILGYGIIAIPTGIMTVEYSKVAGQVGKNLKHCPGCGYENHDEDAVFCKKCGHKV